MTKDKRYLQFLKDRKVNSKEEMISVTTEDNNKPVLQDTTEEKVFARVEFDANFPGGPQAWTKYLGAELQKIDSLPPIRITVRYIIAKDGSVTDPQIEMPIDVVVGKKILSIFTNSPKWIPATQEGKAVNAYRRQPITLGNPEECSE
ncbi:MAG: hypothetical protein EOO07_32355 [Chitinophagaceae bacterium]|nr:MAG: hypothetical protein EOO07_32355 [Chitinophagaceae bacterium]